MEVEGEERAHLVPEGELELHEQAEDCHCRPIRGTLGRHQLVWVHGLR